MKSIFTLLLMMAASAGLVSAQEKKPGSRKTVVPRDSVFGYKFVPKSGPADPLMLTMPVDTLPGENVKMPNSYRKGIIQPVPMPTYKVEMDGFTPGALRPKPSVGQLVRPGKKQH